MKFDEARRLAKKEIKEHGDTTGPQNRYSTNRLNALADTVRDHYGDKAAQEFHKEMISKRR